MIKINNLSVDFKSELTLEKIRVLNSLNFSIGKGDCLGILGESGSGKSTLGRVLVGLLKPSEGEFLYENRNPYISKENKKFLASNISIVFQDYNTSVNPRFTVFEIILESLKVLAKRNGVKNTKEFYRTKVGEILETVGLNDTYIDRFPHQLSGGQLQRVCIARAIALDPKVILFDEAISSLDAHTQVQIMDLLKSLQEKFQLTYIFITHDLTSVTYLCNKVMFLYKGDITEYIDVKDISKTKDEYAVKLLNTVISI